jgi:hypothetical protein
MNATIHPERPGARHARPKTIAIIATIFFAATFIAAMVGFSLLFPNRLLDRLWIFNPAGAVFFRSIGPISGLFLLALGAGTFAAARGLLHGRKWAWRFAVALFAIDGCGDIASFFLIHDALKTVTGVIISLAFLLSLCRRRVRDHFFG